MSGIKGLEGMTVEEINRELERGGKFVVFEYCVSILIMTFKRGSDVHFVRSGDSTVGSSILYTLITLLFGWWGFPWGPIYSFMALFTNLRGGKDVTQEVIQSINARA